MLRDNVAAMTMLMKVCEIKSGYRILTFLRQRQYGFSVPRREYPPQAIPDTWMALC